MTQFVLWLVIPATIVVCAAAVGQLSARRNRIDRAAVERQLRLSGWRPPHMYDTDIGSVLGVDRLTKHAHQGLTAADRRYIDSLEKMYDWNDA